jgi:hypothetical protein
MSRDTTKPKPHAGKQRLRVQTTHPGAPWVPWRSGRYLPIRWRSVIDGEHLPYLAELAFAVGPNGPHCESITFRVREDGCPLSATELRNMPTGALIEAAVSKAAARAEERPGELVIHLENREETQDVRPSRQRGGEAHLKEVRDVYLAAERHPTAAVQDHWPSTPYSTAAHWVAKARRIGLIPPATRGRTSAPREPTGQAPPIKRKRGRTSAGREE